jgi:Tol biopolymer transport system component
VVRNGARVAVLGAVAGAVACLASSGLAAAVQLPDGRGYEMVSPPAKSGADVIRQTNKTHVATDGSGVTFSAVGVFGSPQGTSFDSEYLSRRTGIPATNGWSTHAMNPPGGSETLQAFFTGNVPGYVNAFTPDLSTAIYRSWRPLTDAPNVADVSNLYRIDGLGSDNATAQLMSDAVAPLPPWPPVFKQLKQPTIAGTSTDLRHVVFESQLNLTADAPPEGPVCAAFGIGCPTLLYENAGGVVRLVGRIPNAPETECDDVNGPACIAAPSSQAGVSASRYSGRMVSANGRRIFFQVPADADSGAIYMREDGVRTVQLAEDGQLWAASTDGSRAFFITSDSLLAEDTDSNPDLYMYDATAPAGSRLTLVSASSVNAGTVGTVIGASEDGQYVYFVCDGQLVAGEPSADLSGLYVWHDGSLTYIGQMFDGSEAQLNGPRTGWSFVSSMTTSRLSPDGRHLLFMTQDDAGFRGRDGFDGYDHAGRQELYLYSADTNRLFCASCNPNGRAATTDALTNVRDGAAVSTSTSDLSHALSDDGRYVFFTTAETLVPEDTNGVQDAYEYDVLNGTVHLISSGTDTAPSVFVDASNDGSNVFFVTRQRLVGWDIDNSYDLYDARIHGGFPEPVVSPAQCAGEACLGQNSAAPTASQPSSRGFKGAGNATAKLRRPRVRCTHRKIPRHIRGKTRCVKRRTHRHAHRARLQNRGNGGHGKSR